MRMLIKKGGVRWGRNEGEKIKNRDDFVSIYLPPPFLFTTNIYYM